MAAEPVGVALGVTSIVIALKGTLDSFNLVEGIIRGDHESDHLHLLYEAKRQSVELWADEMRVGTVDSVIEKLNKPSMNLVKQTLIAIEQTHKEAQKYLTRYPSRYDGSKVLDTALGYSSLKDQADRLAATKPLHKFRWAIRDRDKFATAVKLLGEHVDTLIALTSSVSKEVFGQLVAAKVVSAMHDPAVLKDAGDSKGDGLNQVLAIVKLLQSGAADIVGELEPEPESALTLKKGAISNLIPQPATSTQPGQTNQPTKVSTTNTETQTLSLGTFQPPGNALPIPVWVEWRYITSHLPEPQRAAMKSRIKRLGYLLKKVNSQPVFRVPNFIGLYEDPNYGLGTETTRWGFMFSVPEGDFAPSISSTMTKGSFPNPLSLKDYIKGAKMEHIPTLGQRVKLAVSLSITFAMLHSAGWLYKGFSSQTVWFFTPFKGRGQGPPPLENPYITGFSSSRPSDHKSLERKQIGDQYWLHPATSRGFTKRLDLYSLGVVLLEIGLWYSAMDRVPKQHSGSPEAFHQYLSTKTVKELGFRTGRLYQEVVETLLNIGNFLADDDDETLTRELFQSVLRPLMKISVDS